MDGEIVTPSMSLQTLDENTTFLEALAKLKKNDKYYYDRSLTQYVQYLELLEWANGEHKSEIQGIIENVELSTEEKLDKIEESYCSLGEANTWITQHILDLWETVFQMDRLQHKRRVYENGFIAMTMSFCGFVVGVAADIYIRTRQ